MDTTCTTVHDTTCTDVLLYMDTTCTTVYDTTCTTVHDTTKYTLLTDHTTSTTQKLTYRTTITTQNSHITLQGRQEDAEEFLGCILNRLHDELVAAASAITKPITIPTDEHKKVDKTEEEEEDDGEEWQEVGPKNKSTITRRVSILVM